MIAKSNVLEDFHTPPGPHTFRQPGKAIFALLLLSTGCLPAHPQSVSFAGVQNNVDTSVNFFAIDPIAVAVDGPGNLFVADSSKGWVVKISPDGQSRERIFIGVGRVGV